MNAGIDERENEIIADLVWVLLFLTKAKAILK